MAQSGCDDGLTCEVVEGGEPACFAPVVMRGRVFDLLDETAIAGARVVALDTNGAAISEVAVSDDTGAYELSVPSTRREDGTPIPVELTLRAAAADYQVFPSGLRQALPIDTSNPTDAENALVIESVLTEVGLIALPAGAGQGAIAGTVELPESRTGVLVVATSSEGQGFAAVASRTGDYRIFNVPPGDYEVVAYAYGVNYTSVQTALEDAGEAQIDLALADSAPGSVAGKVEIVNASGSPPTSVVLVVESTLDEVLARGQTVPGLRVPTPGTAPNVTGNFLFEGVPAGRYVILAAFENDALVRDPDTSIGGTSVLHIEVLPGVRTEVESFKVTEALEILSPGADGAEAVEGTPTLSWQDDSSEDEYQVQVFDVFGEVVWDMTMAGVSGGTPSIEYAGPALQPGMYYQFRVTSFMKGEPISSSEDLKGVFFVP